MKNELPDEPTVDVLDITVTTRLTDCVFINGEPYKRYSADLSETRADDGWRTIDDCPDIGNVWTWNEKLYNPPILRNADGEWWRCHRHEKFTPTHWRPEFIPAPPQTPSERSE